MNRRDFGRLALGSSLMSFMGLAQAVEAAERSIEEKRKAAEKAALQSHESLMSDTSMVMFGQEQIAMLLYPGFTALDLVGPQYMFAAMMGSKVHLVSPTDDLTPVMCDTGFAVSPTITRKECPEKLDILFIPGSGVGVSKIMRDEAFMSFVKDRAQKAKYVTAVCTGSMVLGLAGVLKGKKATSHWATHHLLEKFGAIPVKDRVVWDGNVVTGGGVTAGIDFGLEVLAAIRGKKYAEGIQLQAEYAPAPPFNAGTPETADPFLFKNLTDMYAPLIVDIESQISG